jgi:RNA methyltransferase, TrmH family
LPEKGSLVYSCKKNNVLVKSQVKYIQSLGQKKVRDAEGAFIAEGIKIINELLIAPNVTVITLFATENWVKTNTLLIKTLPGNKVIEVTEPELNRISFLQTPNEVLGIFQKPLFDRVDFSSDVILLIDEIQDPGNFGTIIRTADWFNIKNIICSKNSTDVFNSKVIQSTMGSVARINVEYEDLEIVLQAHSDIPVYATTLRGRDIFEEKKIVKGFILIGNESKGIKSALLRPEVREITIPKFGSGESLNVAVAAGIVMAQLCGGHSV